MIEKGIFNMLVACFLVFVGVVVYSSTKYFAAVDFALAVGNFWYGLILALKD